MSVHIISHRQVSGGRTERNEFTFGVSPSADMALTTSSSSFRGREPFLPDTIRVLETTTDGQHNSLLFHAWGMPPSNQSWSERGEALGTQFRTTAHPLLDVHFKNAPAWVHDFIRANTPFGDLLDTAMENA